MESLEKQVLKAKAIEAARAYLGYQGYELTEDAGDFDLAALDPNGTLVLIDVDISNEEGKFPKEHTTMEEFEKRMFNYFKENDSEDQISDCRIQYDHIGMITLGEPGSRRALLKHHRKALSI